MAKQLFRKAALDRLASPEQLDVAMQVTSPRGWIALGAVGSVLILIVLWGFLGTVSTKVDGSGILIPGEGLLSITAGSQGRLIEILVAEGDSVSQGDLVARLSQEALELRIRNKREELDEAIAQASTQGGAGDVTSGLYAELRAQQARLERQRESLQKGLITRSTVLATEQRITQIRQQIRGEQDRQTGQENRVDAIRRQLDELERERESSSEVRSPFSGRVIEVVATVGDLVGGGSRLVTMESFESDLAAVFYVPATDGKKVQEGMEVRVSPATVKPEEYGFMMAEVLSVGDYPESPESLMRTLRNQNTVNALTGDGAPFQVVARLEKEPATPSGFRWSSSTGPPVQVFSGTPIMAKVTVEERRPISYVVPIFKKAIGAS
ncbi:MAG: NHLP bacteriocin system secretion protein [Acidobacteria bacterium]|nr:MAG: NHLP bacteriocin system secretion protein [Acidobacteriota bacterium]REK03194.1 MAG: NHLP bacteriocin system secretion protein [Acidobacteriota bacterium]